MIQSPLIIDIHAALLCCCVVFSLEQGQLPANIMRGREGKEAV